VTAGQIPSVRRDIDMGVLVKKLVIASAAMGGAALIAFGASGTFAAFSDQTSAAVSPVAAGTLSLSAGAVTSADLASGPLTPGDTVHRTYLIKNNSADTAGNAFFNVSQMVSKEDGCTSNTEKAADDCWTGAGDLVGQTNASLLTYAPTDGACVAPAGAVFADVGRLQSGPTAPFAIGNLGTGQSLCVDFLLEFVNGSTNDLAQGDSFSATLAFTIEQATATNGGPGELSEDPYTPPSEM
jgi:predicted ribosomally synthesized peptide with SipW-like signal peptide